MSGVFITGSAGADTITPDINTNFGPRATEFNDSISGINGDDSLDAGTGDDIIGGGLGNDVLVGGEGNDSLLGNDGDDTVVGGSGVDTMSGGIGRDLLSYRDDTAGIFVNLAGMFVAGGFAQGDVIGSGSVGPGDFEFDGVEGGSGDDSLMGNTFDNVLIGNGGADTLFANLGADSMDGGEGNDFLLGDSAAADDSQHGADTILGGDGDDTVLAMGGNDVVLGGAGNDSVDGGTGHNSLGGGDGNNSLTGATGNDTLIGGDGADTLIDRNGDDSLDGGAGDDIIKGGVGAQTISAGAGTDFVNFEVEAGDRLIDLGDGSNFLGMIHDWDLGQAIVSNDTILGGADHDGFIIISYGHDQMFLGDGDDSGFAHTSRLTADLGRGNDSIIYGAGFEQLRAGAIFGSSITGGEGNDRIELALASHGTDDTLDGGDGDDSLAAGYSSDNGMNVLIGGAGNDTINLSMPSRTEALDIRDFHPKNQVDLGAGDDVVLAERVTFLGGDGLLLFFSADTIMGGEGNDDITAGAGLDSVFGGAGNDTIRGEFAFRTNLLGDFAASDFLYGEDGNDFISGGDFRDVIFGGAGDDTISGDNSGEEALGTGNPGGDSLSGGTGNDLLSYASSTAAVSVNLLTRATAGGEAAADDIVDDFEGLLGSAFGDSLEGNALANTIEGGAGADTLSGGEGRDLLSYASSTILVIALLEARIVTGGHATGDRISADFEDLLGGNGDDFLEGRLAGSLLMGGLGNDTLSGLIGADTLEGGEGADSLQGGGGADVMRGGAGDDAYWVDNLADAPDETGGGGFDTIYATIDWTLGAGFEKLVLLGARNIDIDGDAQNNRLLGNRGGNVLSGGDGRDYLNGRAGADTLDGGAGPDKLTGGAGNDVFLLANAGDPGDRIMDFAPGEDRIALDASAFGGLLTPGVAPVLTLGDAAVGAGPQLVYDVATGRLLWDANGVGGAGPVLLAVLDNLPALAVADFTVVA